MIAYTTEALDITKFIEQQVKPVRIMRKGTDNVWVVRSAPVDFSAEDQALNWTLYRGGDVMQIPLIPYRTATTALVHLLSAGIDTAQRMARNHPNAKRVHFIVGTPIEDLRPEAEALRFWLGYAVQLQ